MNVCGAVDSYLERMREVNQLIMEDVGRFTENPLAMFPIRKRLALEWPNVLANITNCSMVYEYPGSSAVSLAVSQFIHRPIAVSVGRAGIDQTVFQLCN